VGKLFRRAARSGIEPPPPEADIQSLLRIESRAQSERTFGERVAGFAVRGAGSMTFVAAHVLWFAAWVMVNLGAVASVPPFDPFPFPFLTLVVSLEAIFLALLVLIAQNRITKEADRRALLDLQINLLAERESTRTLDLLQEIGERLGIKADGDEETERLATRTDVEELAEALEKGSP
jgi:uncharacterized membrane protein